MENKPSVAIIRGKFLNAYEMQIFEPLVKSFEIRGFGSLTSYHSKFSFPVTKLPSPMDLPEFPMKMPIVNRIFTDGHYLLGLEKSLQGYDIVHSAETYYHYTQQALNAKKSGKVKKVIATVLENIPFNNEGIMGRKEFKERAREELDHIIALTQRTKAALILEGADEKKITVISHGIDTKRFFPLSKPSANNKDVNILFTGRLEVYKGIYEVIYAFKRLKEDKDLKKHKLSLTIVGEGSEKESLLILEKQLGIANYINHKNVTYNLMPEIYRQANIYVAPSKASKYWVEQYNTGLLEAQSSGLPIVTTYSGGIPENVGDAATLVSPNDFYALSEAIKQYILYPRLRKEFSAASRKRAVSVHDVTIISRKISNLYNSLL